MFRLADLYTSLLKKQMLSDCGIAIERLDAEVAVLNRQLLDDRVSFFSINLITSGSATIIYGGHRLEISRNDLFISAPGIRIFTEKVSADYAGLCLIVEEDVVYKLPYAHNAISASYALANPETENRLRLSDDDFHTLAARVADMLSYLSSPSPYKARCLYSLYAVFSLDLLYIESRLTEDKGLSSTASDLFMRFLKLVRENFLTRHDIEFYADSLAVTSIYLSRVVKNVSGQTVKNHVDRLLMMEARYLLTSTDLTIAEIGSRLGFVTPAGFCKFFRRHQSLSPKDYRKGER